MRFSRSKRWLHLGLLLGMLFACAGVQAQGLSATDFRQIGLQGYGDSANSYSWALAWFKGKLYIGTNHNFLCIIRAGVTSPGLNRVELPGECADQLLDDDVRGRIYTYDPATNQVALVYVSPTFKALTSDGLQKDVARDAGYRTMAVFTEKDGSESLYIGTFTSSRLPQPPARLLRTGDGLHFEEVGGDDGGQTFRSYRSLTVFRNRLYAIGLSSDTAAPVLLEAEDPRSGTFRTVSEPHFGDPVNLGAFELAEFKGHLYVGTFSADAGFQLLKTPALGRPPYEFIPVLVRGAYRGIRSQSVLSMTVFKDQLYVGTGIFYGSFALLDDFKPGASEVLRVNGDDTWEILVGEARDTPDGFKEPLSGLPGGFGNPFVGYLWRMVVHEGVLYAGTLDTAVLAQYVQGINIDNVEEGSELDQWLDDHPEVRDFAQQAELDEAGDIIAALEGGFDLWSTTDGVDWTMVTKTGFGDEFSYGVRTFASTPVGLFVGSANPFLGTRLFLGQPPNTDTDGDSFADDVDNCPTIWNLSQADADSDGIGDRCDPDDDGDCIPDEQDAAPQRADDPGPDLDGDGLPDACDPDDDDDDVLDLQDNCPAAANFDQADADGDGRGNACDARDGSDLAGQIETGEATAEPTEGQTLVLAGDSSSGGGSSRRGAGAMCGTGALAGAGAFLLVMLGWRNLTSGRLLGMALMLSTVWAGPAHAEGLTKKEFRQVGEQGFGDLSNSYAWGMAWFKGKLLIGTNHNFLCTVRAGSAASGLNRLSLPTSCQDEIEDIDFRGRMYAYDPATGQVELVYLSPVVLSLRSDGSETSLAQDAGYRTMMVFREPDGTEALYVGTFTSSSVSRPVARILRSTDGLHFEDVHVDAGAGQEYVSFRSFAVYKDRLFVLGKPAGNSAFILMESKDPASGVFREVSDLSFGSSENGGAFNLEVFAGFLYVGTFGPIDGFQVVKTDATGTPPYRFQAVVVDGGYRGIGSQTVLSMLAYKDHLYVGSGTWFGSLTLLPDFVPKPSEVLRISADDSWELVVGNARETPAGFKEPISGKRAGFGNPFIGYMWRMVEHDGVLYVSTLDTSVFLQYEDELSFADLLPPEKIGPYLNDNPELLDTLGDIPAAEMFDFLTAYEGGFDLWSTTDGVEWTQITHTGFGDEFNYGIRTFASTPVGLFAGSANPFFGLKLYLAQPGGADSDGDGQVDPQDNCPLAWNLSQADLDDDGIGDACDPDDDGDCIPDGQDGAPRVAQASDIDTDEDGQPDLCDRDDDGDEVPDLQDNCPLTPNLVQLDADSDGLGDVCDAGTEGSSTDLGAQGSSARPPEEVAQRVDSGSTGSAGANAQSPCGAGMLCGFAVSLAGITLTGLLRPRRGGGQSAAR
ncbi:MAG: thrombospondin type 3 repeat-containing protein [Phycisphaerae bacterium]